MPDSLDKAKSLMKNFLEKHQDIYEMVQNEKSQINSSSLSAVELDDVEINKSICASDSKLIQPMADEQKSTLSEENESSEDSFLKIKKRMEQIPLYIEARSYGINYLSSVTQTSGKFYEKMRSKAYPEKLIKFLQVEFTKDGLLDDYAVAGLIIDTFRGARAESPFAMKRRLLNRGVDAETVDQIIDEEYSDIDLLLDEFISNRCRSELEEIDTCKDKEAGKKIIARIIRRGQARGFYQSDIVNYLRKRKNNK